MKKILLILLVLIIGVGLFFYFENKKEAQEVNKTKDISMNVSLSDELTEVFDGKFVSFRYPKFFNVVEDKDNIVYLFNNTKQKDLPDKIFVLIDGSDTNDKNLAMDEWYHKEFYRFEREAPVINDDLSRKLSLSNKYNAYYTEFDPGANGIFSKKDYYFGNIEMYINSGKKVFQVNSQKMHSELEGYDSKYSIEEIVEVQRNEKLFWEILDTFKFK